MIKTTILGSGSSGNAVTVALGDSVILVDAGFSGIELERRLATAGVDVADIAAMLISHEHNDHIQGARVFSKRFGHIKVFANALTTERMRMMGKAPENLCIFANGRPFEIGPFTIEAFSVCHDAVDPVGFVIQCGEHKIGIATDLGYPGKMVPLKLYDCSLLILESNHDPEMLRQSSRPAYLQHRIRGRRGHLSNQSAAAMLPDVVGPITKYLVMAHLSDDCNCPHLVETTMVNKLNEIERHDVNVIIAQQHTVGETITL